MKLLFQWIRKAIYFKYKVINNLNHYKDKSLLFWCPLWILVIGIFIFIFTRILSIDLLKLQEKDFVKLFIYMQLQLHTDKAQCLFW